MVSTYTSDSIHTVKGLRDIITYLRQTNMADHKIDSKIEFEDINRIQLSVHDVKEQR